MNFIRAEHNIIDELAFTEDGILIYNIRGTCSSTQNIRLKVEGLVTYFRKFGQILNADLRGGHDRKYFHIQFSRPESAAEALLNPIHTIGNHRYDIHGCCTLEEIDEQRILQQLNATLEHNSLFNNEHFWNSSFGRNAESPILALNDDCLALILNKLPLSDQLYFAASCKRFCAVFAWLSTARYRTLHTDYIRQLTPLRIGIFFQIVGPLIETLILNAMVFVYESDHYLKFAGSYCTNVVNLTLIKCFIDGGFCMRKFLKRMTSLEELTLNITGTEQFCRYLREFQNFKSLKIFLSLTNESEIHTLTGLEKLVLRNSDRETPNLRIIFRNLTNLIYLDIRKKLLELEAFELISKHLLQLQTLRITYGQGSFSSLAKLPKLKMFELELESYVQQTTRNCVDDIHLAVSMAQQLEEFRISTPSRLTGSSEIASCLSKLENLKVLHWKMDVSDEILSSFSQLTKLEEIALGSCQQITDEGVLSLLKNCSKLQQITFFKLNPEETYGILINSLQLLNEQRDGGLRDFCVYFFFDSSFYNEHFDINVREREFSDVLKIGADPSRTEADRLFDLSSSGKRF